MLACVSRAELIPEIFPNAFCRIVVFYGKPFSKWMAKTASVSRAIEALFFNDLQLDFLCNTPAVDGSRDFKKII